MKNKLELRMYGLVPYNISPIQQGIQFGHSVVEYERSVGYGVDSELYEDWADNWKTFIILNGGTTNNDKDSKWYGSMNHSRDMLNKNGIVFSEFKEPDLGNQLTAVTFIVDERVFKTKPYKHEDPETTIVYLDFPEWLENKHGSINRSRANILSLEQEFSDEYSEWVDFVGGEKNVFLRKFLRNFKLA